jgi:CRISPR/Cas system-associated exonuclease Cas4 (RecB family)
VTTNNPGQDGDDSPDHVAARIEQNPSQAVGDRISNQDFNAWYEDRQIEQNILDGKSYFNGPSPPKDPDRHTPSKLLQCHRKASYARQNAPREGTSPEGLFWIGSEFEEQIIVPYLQSIVPDELYVQNSLWIDTTISNDEVEVHLRGSTDPAIVTSDADPVYLTEIKTTTSLDHLTEPKEHHRAQLHAYLYALDKEYDYPITNGLLVYGSRKTLDIKVFHVTFDEVFWHRIIEWMTTQTEYEEVGELPPADPEREWECSYCSYKHRCGEADTPYSAIGHDGLLPLLDEYDRQNLVEYLEAHTDADAKLTPTLAHAHPDLVEEYGAFDWSCPRCDNTYAWDAVDWGGDTTDPPVCPNCLDNGDLLTLSGPEPEEQHTS